MVPLSLIQIKHALTIQQKDTDENNVPNKGLYTMLKGNLAGPTVWHAGETGHIYYLNTGCLVSDHSTQTRT